MSAEEGHLATSKVLVEAGSNLNAVSCSGHTPLHLAAAQGRGGVVRLFIEKGANVNRRSNTGITPLYLAAQNGRLEATRQFLLARADPLLTATNQGPKRMSVQLDVATQQGHIEVVHELIRMVGIEGCGGATAGWDALDLAARRNNVDIIAVLIDAGVVDTGVALHHACSYGSEAAVKTLVQQRRKVWGTSSVKGPYVGNTFQPWAARP